MRQKEKNAKFDKSVFKYRSLRIAVCLLILTLFTVCFIVGVNAKFIFSNVGSDGSHVAKFSLTPGTEVVLDAVLKSDFYPGEECEWEFTLTKDSETSMKCSAIIETTGNLPLTYTLQAGSTTVALSTEEYTQFLLCTPKDSLPDVFTLTIAMPSEADDIAYMNEFDVFHLIIKAEQVD